MLRTPLPAALFWLPPMLLGSARLLDAVILSLLLGLLLGVLAPLHRRLGPGLAPAIALLALGTAVGGLAQLSAEALGLFPPPAALLLLGALGASLIALPRESRTPMLGPASAPLAYRLGGRRRAARRPRRGHLGGRLAPRPALGKRLPAPAPLPPEQHGGAHQHCPPCKLWRSPDQPSPLPGRPSEEGCRATGSSDRTGKMNKAKREVIFARLQEAIPEPTRP